MTRFHFPEHVKYFILLFSSLHDFAEKLDANFVVVVAVRVSLCFQKLLCGFFSLFNFEFFNLYM